MCIRDRICGAALRARKSIRETIPALAYSVLPTKVFCGQHGKREKGSNSGNSDLIFRADPAKHTASAASHILELKKHHLIDPHQRASLVKTHTFCNRDANPKRSSLYSNFSSRALNSIPFPRLPKRVGRKEIICAPSLSRRPRRAATSAVASCGSN